MSAERIRLLEKKVEQLTKQVVSLRAILRHFVPIDDEGEYKPSFVKKAKRMAKEPATIALTENYSLLDALRDV